MAAAVAVERLMAAVEQLKAVEEESGPEGALLPRPYGPKVPLEYLEFL